MRVRPTLVLIGVCLLQLSLAALPKLELRPNNDICQYFKDGTVLRQPGYCDRTIKCQNGVSMPDTNCKTTEIWSLTRKRCGTTSDSYCSAPCAKSSPRFVSDPKNCEGWYECDGTKKIRSGYCANQMWFDQGTQLCMYPSQTNCLVKYSFCDVVPTGVSIPDYYNCHQYVQCNDKGNEEVFTCPLGQYFDIASGECIRNSLVNCYKHPVPEDVCGTTKLPIRDRFVDDRATCRGYFFCKNQYAYIPDPEPAWGQCPLGFFFYEPMQACLPAAQVKCTQDRCDGIVEGLTLSERFGCQHYLTCRNNATMDEFQCPSGQYFDAVMRRCTETYQRYSVCS